MINMEISGNYIDGQVILKQREYEQKELLKKLIASIFSKYKLKSDLNDLKFKYNKISASEYIAEIKKIITLRNQELEEI